MRILFLILLILISFLSLRIYGPKLRLKKFFKEYSSSIKSLALIKKNQSESNRILDNISVSGSKLILRLFALILPFLLTLFCFQRMSITNLEISLFLSCVPYLLVVKNL